MSVFLTHKVFLSEDTIPTNSDSTKTVHFNQNTERKRTHLQHETTKDFIQFKNRATIPCL